MRIHSTCLLSAALLLATACESPVAPSAPAGDGPTDRTTQTSGPSSSGGGGASNTGGQATIGPSCVTSDASHQCIGLKIVSYQDGSGAVVLTQDDAIKLVAGVNDIWKACNIAFQIEEYDQVDPTKSGLSYGAASQNELSKIRQTYSNSNTFLLAATGPWNTSTIAWTELPGAGPYGAIVDSQYASHAVAVGHELGHYMGLDHDPSQGNVMYYIVYDTDTAVTQAQCTSTRATNQGFWSKMLRK